MADSDTPTRAKTAFPGWRPQRAVCFVFSDETSEERSGAEMQEFISDLRDAANKHGFDLSMHGTRASFARFFHKFFKADGTYKDD
jgi:hypothetical protein